MFDELDDLMPTPEERFDAHARAAGWTPDEAAAFDWFLRNTEDPRAEFLIECDV